VPSSLPLWLSDPKRGGERLLRLGQTPAAEERSPAVRACVESASGGSVRQLFAALAQFT
jgi:hypothetical protein